jgi:uncharacterized membrane protein
MEHGLKQFAEYIALGVEIFALLFVAYGAAEAVLRSLGPSFGRPAPHDWRKKVWVSFGMWLLLGLQFALAADIVRSVILPTWTDIGQLAAIAAIRTFLNYFLERDLEKLDEHETAPKGAQRAEAA